MRNASRARAVVVVAAESEVSDLLYMRRTELRPRLRVSINGLDASELFASVLQNRTHHVDETKETNYYIREWSGVQVCFPRVDGLPTWVLPFIGEGRVRRRLRAARLGP